MARCNHLLLVAAAGSGVDKQVAECIIEAAKQMEELGVSLCSFVYILPYLRQ